MARAKRGWFTLFTLGAFYIVTAWAAPAAKPGLSGRVTDENEVPVAGARVLVRAQTSSQGGWKAETDPTGAFSLSLPAAGDYLIDIQREGFYALKERPIHIETTVELALVIQRVREVFQSVDVNEQPSPVEITQTRNEVRLTGTEINQLPYRNSHNLSTSMKLMPGVVEDPAGGVHFNGSSENQVQYVLNGFNITDPISGRFRTALAVESVQSMEYASGRNSPEFGKGAAGVLAIRTQSGTDSFRYTATGFIPGPKIDQGLRLGNWHPRFGVSGPIAKGRAWFSNTFDFGYNTSLVNSLPRGENTRSGWAGSNLLHTQVNLSPRNILFADFLVNVNNDNRVGLGPLDPISTTQTVRAREYFGSVKQQLFLGRGSMIEIGYAHNEFSNSHRPLGRGVYVFSPQGRSGNHFLTSSQTATREQFLIHANMPQFQWAGSHQIEIGVDADLLRYSGSFHRTGYELVGFSGRILSQTSYQGSGLIELSNTEAAGWVLDRWSLSRQFQLNTGIRQDWDRLVGRMNWSPRIAFSWSPFEAAHTRVAGGYSVTRDAAPLDPFGRAYDQTAITTEFDPNGNAVGQPATAQFARGSRLRLPRAIDWSLSVDHEFAAHLTARVSLLRRRIADGFSFIDNLAPDAPPSLLPLPNGASAGLYRLANFRRDRYDSVQISVHRTLSGQHEWMASYTRSRAQSNAVLDTSITVPLQILPGPVPMPWDSPHRVLAWAYVPLPWKNWSAAALADARSGFPFSVQQQTGMIRGGVNSYRYPFNFDLNLAIERMLTLHGYRFAVRGGVTNVTNARNPVAVNNVIESPQYLQFLGNEGRHYVVRVRFFGAASK